jgi:hypothetical protein
MGNESGKQENRNWIKKKVELFGASLFQVGKDEA